MQYSSVEKVKMNSLKQLDILSQRENKTLKSKESTSGGGLEE